MPQYTKLYRTLEDLPEWAYNPVIKAIKLHLVHPTGPDTYYISEDFARILVTMDNIGWLGE